ncbi:MAG: TonB C-terminal domain-containing protein [Sulfuricurvum sp.]|uniref:TonB C-terminal domain-containing protein n=1 Tax=Sulfuricurvum sp. TaxID=2025608 RepID=UPI0026266A1F|nr:TonB C-terminal domain-containing protein [Sulfuricurvum sp.]MDD5158421.1 TonB C-terminal domain-containing protein [Sulfuricurvum sp.]
MDLNQERYFFISGLISLSLFVAFLFLAGYSLIVSPKIEQFAMVQSDVINVSIALSEIKATEQIDPEPKVEPLKADPVPDTATQPVEQPEKVPEISDLFAQVKPQKIPKKPLEVTKQNEQLNALEKELLKHKETPRFSDKVSKVELAKPSVKMVIQGGSTGPLVNEYHAKIQALVYANFHPPAGTAGEAARVRMNISASGKLIGYKVISYSGNGTFNGEVDWLSDRLNALRFPEHPEGKDTVLEFILTAKG